MTVRRVLYGVVLSTLLLGSAHAAEGHWAGAAASLSASLGKVEELSAKGDIPGAKLAITEAYFGVFEDLKFEAAIRRFVGAKRAADLERKFADLRKAVVAKEAGKVQEIIQSLRTETAAEAKVLDDAKVTPDVFEVNQ